MKILQLALVGALLAGASVSTASAQSSFDCRRPRSEAIATICATPQLADRDRQVDAAYRRAMQSAAEPNRVRDSHTAWANGLNICGADRQCLAELLDEELEALEYASRPVREVEAPAISKPPPEPELVERPVQSQAQPDEEQPAQPTYDLPPQEVLPAAEMPPETLEAVPAAPDQPTTPAKPKRKVADWEKAAFGGLLLIPILAVVLALLATRSLANHTSRRFNWPLIMNWWNVLYLVGIFGGLFVSTFAGPAGGLGLFGAICAVMLVVNIIKTDPLTGIAMTVVQPLVVVIMWFGYCLARGQVQGRRP